VRITRQQNFIVANVPDERVDEVVAGLAGIGLELATSHPARPAVGCTGEPHCNFSVTETKQRLGRLIEHLEARFGDAISSLGLQLDGCPHACAQHWIADLGFQARRRATPTASACRLTTSSCAAASAGCADRQGAVPARPERGARRGGAGLIQGWLDGRSGEDESFPVFARRQSDEQLGLAAGLEPVKGRVREEAE